MAAPSNYGNRNEERAPDPSGLRESRVIAINRCVRCGIKRRKQRIFRARLDLRGARNS